jgi:hypothetical protein
LVIIPERTDRHLRKIAYVLVTCGLLICLLVASERPAYGYVDPGSGLFLLQGISSAFLGVLYVIRRKLKLGKVAKTTEAGAPKPVASATVRIESVRDAVDRVA